MNYPLGRIVVLRENKAVPAIPEVRMCVLLLRSITDTADLPPALGRTCFMATTWKQLSLSRSVVCLFPLLRLTALVSLIG